MVFPTAYVNVTCACSHVFFSQLTVLGFSECGLTPSADDTYVTVRLTFFEETTIN